MMVTAKSRAAALGVPELPRRNYWYQRWGGTDPQRQRSQNAHQPRLQKSLIKKFNLPNQPLLLHVTQTNIQPFCWKGMWDFCWVQCRVCTELVTPRSFCCVTDFTTSLSERVLFPSRWWGTRVSNTGWSVSELVPVFESSQHQTGREKPCKMLHPGVHRGASCRNPTGSRACSSHFYSEGQQCCLHWMDTGCDISEPTWYLTKSFSDGDGTFISSKENLLK